MSYAFDGSNDTMSGTFASTYADPITLAMFIKVAAHPLATDTIFTLGNSNSVDSDNYQLRTNTTDNQWRASTVTSTPAFINAVVTVDIDGVWAGYVGVFTNGSLRDIYVQAIGNTNQNTTAASPAITDALQFIRVGENMAGTNDFGPGNLAELAIWNAALTTQEITDYLAGRSATEIAPSNLIGYWPLSASNATQANEGIDAGGDLTVTGATFDADHPTITFSTVAPTLYVVRSGIRLQ